MNATVTGEVGKLSKGHRVWVKPKFKPRSPSLPPTTLKILQVAFQGSIFMYLLLS